MSGILVALVGFIYFYVSIDMLLSGKFALAMVWFGYSFAQIGLYFVTTQK